MTRIALLRLSANQLPKEESIGGSVGGPLSRILAGVRDVTA
jgi:hypothetical protein